MSFDAISFLILRLNHEPYRGAMSSGSFAFDGRYKVPASLTIVMGEYKNPNLSPGNSTHSHTFDADTISKADSAECASKRLLIIKIAPKISITCR